MAAAQQQQQQQQQPDVLAFQRPLPSQFHRSQRMGCCRWMAAVLSALALAALSAAMVLISPDSTLGEIPEDVDEEPSSAEVVERQFQTYHAKAQRFTLHASLGQIFFSEGRFAEAATHYSSARELAQSEAEQAQAGQLLGLVCLRQGRLRDARKHLERALAHADRSIDVAVLRALANVRAEMGHLEQALKLYDQAFKLAERRRDADEMTLLASDTGEAWARKGNLQETLVWLGKASELLGASRRSGPGADERVAARVRSFFGAAHHLLGQIPRAVELYNTAARAQMRLLPPSHPDIVATRLGLARAHRDLGDPKSALRAIEAIERTLRDGPQEGPDLSRVLIFKSDMLREANRMELAEEAIREALRRQNLQATPRQGEGHPEDHPDAAVALSSYGSILHDLGRADEAHEKYRQALAINLRTVGEKHPSTAAAYNSLGTLYEDLGDDSTARQHFSKCLSIQLDTVGRDNPDVANTYNNLATVLFRQGQRAEAALLLRRALRVLEAAGVPRDSPDCALYEDNLREVLSAAKIAGPGYGIFQGLRMSETDGIVQDDPWRLQLEDLVADAVLEKAIASSG